MSKWHEYAKEDPPNESIGKMLKVKVKYAGYSNHEYETEARWEGICFMTLDDEDDPESWSGPLRLVTHWAFMDK